MVEVVLICQKTYALVLGVILLLVGVVGFAFEDTLLWFGINSVHNWVHILSGILALIAGWAAGGSYARTYNQVFGIVYLLVAILGLAGVVFVMDLLNLNTADNLLHLAIGLVTTCVGFFAKSN